MKPTSHRSCLRVDLLAILLLYLFLPPAVLSQSPAVDSLNILLEKATDQKEIATLLLTIAAEYSEVDYRGSIEYSKKALIIGEKLKDDKIIGKSYLRMARDYSLIPVIDSANIFIDRSIEILSNPFDSVNMATAYNVKGIVMSLDQQFTAAIDYQFKSATISEKLKQFFDAGAAYNSLGNLYMRIQDEENALKFYELGVKNMELAEDDVSRASILMNMVYLIKDDNEKKMSMIREAEMLSEKLSQKRLAVYVYSMYADYYEKNVPNIDSQIYYYTKSADLAADIGDEYMVAFSNLYLGGLVWEEAPEESAFKLKKALEHEYIDSDAELKADGNFYLSKALNKIGKSEEAYVRLDSALSYYKKQFNTQLIEKTSQANAQFETEKKDVELARQELEIAKKDNQRNILIASASIGLFLLSGIFLWYFQRQKLKKKEAELALLEEQKETEKLKELDEMKTHFFTNVSHELRTPLTLILGPLADALEKVKQPELKRSIHLAYNNADRLNEMINEVLDLSKLESGHIKLEQHAVALKPFIKRILFAFESMAEMRNVKLEIDGTVDNFTISTDEDKLEKILNNLISNAIKYSPNNAVITLTAKIVDGQLAVSVKDEGQGIHPDEKEKIFNRFYQSNIITAVEGGGTGVGLALSRELAELFGGTLTVESVLNEGSKFILSIPVVILEEVATTVEGDLEQSKEENVYTPILINGEKPHILIIEDNGEMRDYLAGLLETEYRCSFANDGYAALQQLQKGNYDIISSDIMMPHMDGFELKKKVNELPGLKNIPFIFLTARSLEEDKIAGLRLGVDDYISKPFNKYEYRARIHNLLKNKVEREQWLATSTDPIQHVNIEEDILKKAEASILANMSNADYKVNNLATDLNYSQRQLTRIVKNLTGLTPVNFILELRLQKAHHFLKSKSFHTVNEVRFEVGIDSASYFARKFKERFGISPGEI